MEHSFLCIQIFHEPRENNFLTFKVTDSTLTQPTIFVPDVEDTGKGGKNAGIHGTVFYILPFEIHIEAFHFNIRRYSQIFFHD